jgi:hypothetical protein
LLAGEVVYRDHGTGAAGRASSSGAARDRAVERA